MVVTEEYNPNLCFTPVAPIFFPLFPGYRRRLYQKEDLIALCQ